MNVVLRDGAEDLDCAVPKQLNVSSNGSGCDEHFGSTAMQFSTEVFVQSFQIDGASRLHRPHHIHNSHLLHDEDMRKCGDARSLYTLSSSCDKTRSKLMGFANVYHYDVV